MRRYAASALAHSSRFGGELSAQPTCRMIASSKRYSVCTVSGPSKPKPLRMPRHLSQSTHPSPTLTKQWFQGGLLSGSRRYMASLIPTTER